MIHKRKKINEFHQNLKFCFAKYSVMRMKGQSSDFEKIFTNHIPNKGPISIIHKGLSKFNGKNFLKKIQLENGEKA